MDGIEAYITQLHAGDPGSFGFRYPLTKDGTANPKESSESMLVGS
jgi:hypothetical protein